MTPSPRSQHSIPADLRLVDEMMYHYGEWARKRFVIQTCGSVEKKYRSPDWETTPGPTYLATWKAVDIQRVVQSLPMLERMCLWAQYRADDHGFATKFCHGHGLRTRDAWHECHVRGLRMLRNRLNGFASEGIAA